MSCTPNLERIETQAAQLLPERTVMSLVLTDLLGNVDGDSTQGSNGTSTDGSSNLIDRIIAAIKSTMKLPKV
jgi:type II secretory pathway component PulL